MTEGKAEDGGEGGREQEAMPVHLCQSQMETVIINSHVSTGRGAGHSALQHQNLD